MRERLIWDLKDNWENCQTKEDLAENRALSDNRKEPSTAGPYSLTRENHGNVPGLYSLVLGSLNVRPQGTLKTIFLML